MSKFFMKTIKILLKVNDKEQINGQLYHIIYYPWKLSILKITNLSKMVYRGPVNYLKYVKGQDKKD